MRRNHSEKEKRFARDASKKKIAIVVSEYYFDEVTSPMLRGALETLRAWGVEEKNIAIVRVPGSFEIPNGCLSVLRKGRKIDAIVTLGCIVKGKTKHDEYIASAVSHSLMRLMETYKISISFGVLTVNTLKQAIARSTGRDNKGVEAAVAALEMALL